jgi:protein subunit release factor A
MALAALAVRVRRSPPHEHAESRAQHEAESKSSCACSSLLRDPNDDKKTIVEIRGGTGGEEAALVRG